MSEYVYIVRAHNSMSNTALSPSLAFSNKNTISDFVILVYKYTLINLNRDYSFNLNKSIVILK